jgi:acylphosphatase
MICHRIHFFGNVQGVGFRYTTCSVARGFEVTGFVRNRPNGSVELVVEGESDEIERFLESLRDRMSGHIEREEIVTESTSGAFIGFGIR